MIHSASRREFLKSAFIAGAGLALAPAGARLFAAEPFKRPGDPRLLLSLAAYSFRDYMKDGRSKKAKEPEAAKNMDMFQFVAYCADQGCLGAELTSYYFPQDLTADYLLRLKRHAFLRGVEVSGTAVGNNFTHPKGEKRDSEIAHVKKWVDYAAILGAPHIRVFAGAPGTLSKEEAKGNCVDALTEACQYAGSKGVFLGLENHGGIVAESDDLLDILKAVKSPWVGINLDTGNFRTADPYADIAKCAPYAVNVQFKAEIHPKDKPVEAADYGKVMGILRAANYQGYVALEYESKEDPYTAVPGILQKLKAQMG